MKEQWLVFYHNGKEICRYTMRGTFSGEREETIKLLAADRGISETEIITRIEERK